MIFTESIPVIKEDLENPAVEIAKPVEESVIPTFKTWVKAMNIFWAVVILLSWFYLGDRPMPEELTKQFFVQVLCGYLLSLTYVPILWVFGTHLYGIYCATAVFVFVESRLSYTVHFYDPDVNVLNARYSHGPEFDEFNKYFYEDIIISVFWPLYIFPAFVDIVVDLCVLFVSRIIF